METRVYTEICFILVSILAVIEYVFGMSGYVMLGFLAMFFAMDTILLYLKEVLKNTEH